VIEYNCVTILNYGLKEEQSEKAENRPFSFEDIVFKE